jgi:methylenetetrahydrofolate reductase (NADPH)
MLFLTGGSDFVPQRRGARAAIYLDLKGGPRGLTTAGRPDISQTLARFVNEARLEVIPLPGVEKRVSYLPSGATVTITCSPTRGLEPTLRLTERLAASGFRAVPHLSSRLLESRAHLRAILARLEECATREIFVIGGDAHRPVGPYESAASMLAEMRDLHQGFERVGVAAYPERHPFIDHADLRNALLAKQAHAHYMVSQICFDAAQIFRWLDDARANGISLPLYIGFPGDISLGRLMKFAMRIGVGDSARFLGAHASTVIELARSRYTPDTLLTELAPGLARTERGIDGFHINTFNEIEPTERWRKNAIKTVLSSAEDVPARGFRLPGTP